MNRSLASCLSAVVLAAAVLVMTPAYGQVDPALVGTWHLQGGIANVYWVVRSNGDYRLHGPGVRPAQRGRFTSGGGKWSISAPGWQDAGTYRLQDANTWINTSPLGTGTWVRIWSPNQQQQDPRGDWGVCDWLKPSEVAYILGAPVKAPQGIHAIIAQTREATGGCRYESQLGERVEIETQSTANKRDDMLGLARRAAKNPIAVPNLGEDAYATVDGPLVMLRGKGRVIKLNLIITASSAEDLPALVELARIAYSRVR
jgi:hypothetical protein